MALKLVYANIDYPYAFENGEDVVTTGQVALWLESGEKRSYHIKEAFHKKYKDQINAFFAEALRDAMMDFVMTGRPIPTDKRKLFKHANDKVDALFRNFLNKKIVEGLGIEGVPTQAALKGYSKRLKKLTGKRRPSFIDTGQYRNSSKSYVK